MHNQPVRAAVTIRDVARVADVHPGTVSRALNEQTRALVNPETAERVLRAAEQLGYRPNPIARGLKTNRSFTVGVVIPDLTNPLFPPIMRGIEDRLAEAGYTALIVNTDNDADRERSQIAAMRARQVDGFIAATARLDHELLAEAGAGGTPLVLVNRSFEDGSVPAVTVDDREGIRLAVEHVAALGHQRIGHLAGPQNVSTGHRRYLGFLEAMRAAGLDVPDGAVTFTTALTEAEGARACAELLERQPRVTAVVAGNDRLAMGCYDTLDARGLSCPRGRLGRRLQRHAVHRPAASAADLGAGPAVGDRHRGGRPLAAAARGPLAQPAREILLEPSLVIRASTGPPAG